MYVIFGFQLTLDKHSGCTPSEPVCPQPANHSTRPKECHQSTHNKLLFGPLSSETVEKVLSCLIFHCSVPRYFVWVLLVRG